MPGELRTELLELLAPLEEGVKRTSAGILAQGTHWVTWNYNISYTIALHTHQARIIGSTVGENSYSTVRNPDFSNLCGDQWIPAEMYASRKRMWTLWGTSSSPRRFVVRSDGRSANHCSCAFQ